MLSRRSFLVSGIGAATAGLLLPDAVQGGFFRRRHTRCVPCPCVGMPLGGPILETEPPCPILTYSPRGLRRLDGPYDAGGVQFLYIAVRHKGNVNVADCKCVLADAQYHATSDKIFRGGEYHTFEHSVEATDRRNIGDGLLMGFMTVGARPAQVGWTSAWPVYRNPDYYGSAAIDDDELFYRYTVYRPKEWTLNGYRLAANIMHHGDGTVSFNFSPPTLI